MGILLDIENRTTTLTYIIQNRLERYGTDIMETLEELKKDRKAFENMLSDDEYIEIYSRKRGETLREL